MSEEITPAPKTVVIKQQDALEPEPEE